MKIAVLGAGAMGAVYGARLARGGAEVTLLDVNDDHISVINQNGLHVSLDDGDHVARLPAMRPEQFNGPVDVILLFTKIFHTDAALQSVAGLLDGAFVLSLQNGVGNVERIEEHVPTERILIGITMTPAEFVAPGRVASHGAATTSFHSADGTDRPILHEIADLMRTGGIDAKVDPDIYATIWEKAAFNCAANAIAALTGATPGAVGSSPQGRQMAGEIAREAVSVATALGVGASLERVMALLEHAYAHHLYHEPSMLQDRNHGRRTEISALNGAVVEMGSRLGISVETNRVVSLLIGLMEDATRFRNSRPE